MLLANFLEALNQYDALITIIGIGATWAVALHLYYRGRADWQYRVFIEQINFSLNDIRDNRLILRTLYEASARDVLVSPHAVSLMRKGAMTTTREQPFFHLESDDDWGFVMRGFLNVLSERFAHAHLAKAMGQPIAVGEFVFGATFECYGEMNTRKVRVILMEKQTFERCFGPDADPALTANLQFDAPTHADRLTTLRAMGQLYFSDKPQDQRYLRVVELGVAAS